MEYMIIGSGVFILVYKMYDSYKNYVHNTEKLLHDLNHWEEQCKIQHIHP